MKKENKDLKMSKLYLDH